MDIAVITCIKLLLPLPKQKYGNGMGHAWEENRRLLILWETYGNKVPIHIPYQ